MSAFPSHCPKCGADPIKETELYPGETIPPRHAYYRCDTLISDSWGIIERRDCFQRQRNQVVDALRWALDQIDDDLDLDHRAALESARATLNRLTGGVK